MAYQNSAYINVTGVVKSDGAGNFSGVPVTNHRVLIGSSSNGITSLAAGNTGQILQSAGASDPTWSTPTYPSVSGVTGRLIRSDGTNNLYSTATFPATVGATGTVLQSNGSGWIASTPTFPNTAGTNLNVVQSDGTNFVSAAAPGAGSWTQVSVTLTSAQVKALNGSPITIVAAQGAGKVIVPHLVLWKLTYGGSTAFVDVGCNVRMEINGSVYGSGVSAGLFFNQTASCYRQFSGTGQIIGAATAVENQAFVINNAGTQISGDVLNDSTVTVTTWYEVI